MEPSNFFQRHRKAARWSVRLLILGLSIFLLIGGPLPDYAARLIPALSPVAIFSTALAQRAWYISLVWSLPALLIVALALWKGRFFCRWICPLGTFYSIPSQFSQKKRFFRWELRGFIFWFAVFASVAGLPLILFLDPLATFMRISAMSQGTAHLMAWIPGALIPLMLLLSLFQPLLWCTKLCPLGYFVELIHLKRKTKKKINQGRRDMLAGLVFGTSFAVLFKKVARAITERRPVLPPGAKDLDTFSAACIRCYACVGVCPTGVLTVRKNGGVAEFCIPEMDFDKTDGSYCEQYCNACSQICPTGAIHSLTMDEKQHRRVATASIIREACLAWEDRTECMACDEFCGYNAIEHRVGRDGIAKPFVNPQKCRGCGACRNICPATRIGNAIKIEPLLVQELVTQEDDNSALKRHHGRST